MIQPTKFINASQVGGIDRYELSEGPGRGVRVLCVDTGAGLRYRIQPEPRAGRMEMSVTGIVKYGAFYGPWMELRRTIRSRLGENFIEFVDEFVNVGAGEKRVYRYRVEVVSEAEGLDRLLALNGSV